MPHTINNNLPFSFLTASRHHGITMEEYSTLFIRNILFFSNIFFPREYWKNSCLGWYWRGDVRVGGERPFGGGCGHAGQGRRLLFAGHPGRHPIQPNQQVKVQNVINLYYYF